MASVGNIILTACLLSGLAVDAADVPLTLIDCQQSSVFGGQVCGWAIDGNTRQDSSGAFCSHTTLEEAPWWQAKTVRLANISQVRIYNRLCGAACSAHFNNFVIKVDGIECASYRSDTFFSVETFTCGKVGQVVEITSRKQTYLMPCEVQVFGTYVTLSNTAAPLPLHDCQQSSVFGGQVCGWAIDGNIRQDSSGAFCSHTTLEDAPWWKAKTERMANISQVRIYNRLCSAACSAHLNNFVIKVDGVECASYRSDTFFSMETFTCGKVGQVVEITSRKQTYLMPCEVQVFGTYVTPITEVKPEAPVPCKTPELPPCIDKHDLSKHNVSTSWVTKVPADEFCYQYTCTGKATDGVPVLTQCMDASGNCVNPGDKFACRPNPNNAVNCQCVRRLGNTTVETV